VPAMMAQGLSQTACFTDAFLPTSRPAQPASTGT
jgi:hypothetical protein